MKPLFILFSGKRKSGKDFCASRLIGKLRNANISTGSQGVSYQLKKSYAEHHPDVDFTELLTDSPYKEKYRKDMIEWGEKQRNKDIGVFCRMVEEEARNASKYAVFVIPDCRRRTDFEYFQGSGFSKLTVRVMANEEIRQSRGWEFVKGIDDEESECGLDRWEKFDFVIDTGEEVEKQIQELFERILYVIKM